MNATGLGSVIQNRLGVGEKPSVSNVEELAASSKVETKRIATTRRLVRKEFKKISG